MTSGRASREARAQKAAAGMSAMRKAESRRKNSIRGGIVAVVLLIVVGFGALIQSQRGGLSSADDGKGIPGGTTGTANQSIVEGKADAPVTVTIYEDFQCPACQQFEGLNGPTLKGYVAEGKIKVEYRPIAFLDRASSTAYSTRSLNAVGCVINDKPAAFQKFHDALFTQQPQEGGPGLPDSQLAATAKEAGASDVTSCIKDQKFKDWTKKITDQASKDKVVGTPTIKVNGETLKGFDPAAVKAAIDAAVTKAGGKKKATPSGSATPSPSTSGAG